MPLELAQSFTKLTCDATNLFLKSQRIPPVRLADAIRRLQCFHTPSNAAHEWQAKGLRWRSRELAVACPLDGLVRGWQDRKSAMNISQPWN